MEEGVDALPPEVWRMVFDYLTPQEACISSGVCSLWYQLLTDQNMWKKFHERDLGFKARPPLASNEWRESYRMIFHYVFKSEEVTLVPMHCVVGEDDGTAKRLIRAIRCGADVLVKKIYTSKTSMIGDMFWYEAAVRCGNLEVAKLLVKEWTMKTYKIPLLEAACKVKNNIDIVTWILDCIAFTEKEFEFSECMQNAIQEEDLQLVKLLIARGVPVYRQLPEAAQVGNIAIINEFLQPNVIQNVVEDLASAMGHVILSSKISIEDKVELLRKMVEAGGILEFPDFTLRFLMKATTANNRGGDDDWPHPFLLDVIFDSITYLNSNDKNSWDSACFTVPAARRANEKSKEFMQRLKSVGFNINGVSVYSELQTRILTPLQYAASVGEKQLLLNLLDCGADPSKIVQGASALSIAKQQGHSEIVEILSELERTNKKREREEDKKTESKPKQRPTKKRKTATSTRKDNNNKKGPKAK